MGSQHPSSAVHCSRCIVCLQLYLNAERSPGKLLTCASHWLTPKAQARSDCTSGMKIHFGSSKFSGKVASYGSEFPGKNGFRKPGLLEAAFPVLEAQLDVEPAEAAAAILTIPLARKLLRASLLVKCRCFLHASNDRCDAGHSGCDEPLDWQVPPPPTGWQLLLRSLHRETQGRACTVVRILTAKGSCALASGSCWTPFFMQASMLQRRHS